MPFIAPNVRGKTSQPEKPPWVRDTSSQQSVKDVLRADAPWRRQNNGGEVPTPQPTPPESNSQASKPGTSKLQINLKSAVKKPEPEPPRKPQESAVPVKKEITIPIQFKEDSPAPTSSLPTSSNSSNDYKPKINSSKVKYLPAPPANNDLVQPISSNNLAKKDKERDSPIRRPELPKERDSPVRKPEPPRERDSPVRKPEPPKERDNLLRKLDVQTATFGNEIGKERQIPIQKAEPPKGRDSPVNKTIKPEPLKKESPVRKVESPQNREEPSKKLEAKENKESPLKKAETKEKAEKVPLLRKTEGGVKEKETPFKKVEATKERASPLRKTDSVEERSSRESPSRKIEAPVKGKDSPIKKPEPFSKKSANAEREKQVPITPEKPQPPEPAPSIKHNLKPVDSKTKNSSSAKAPAASSESSNKSSSNMPGPPPPPPPPPGPPPPPPPPGLPPSGPVNPAKKKVIESLRKTPRRRPDWSDMMKQIETAKERKLKHVECNDRSKPILPRMKSRGKFVFDSEAKPANKADAIHNRLLTEIASGVRLKKVTTNDRSKPILTGLRKFRRQLTMEEKDKAQGTTEDTPPPPGDEESLGIEGLSVGIDIDDIDTLRDELQSAKQMLELEIQAKLLLAKENRDLKCQNITMESHIEGLRYDLQKQLSLIPYDEGRRDSRAFKDLRKSKSGLYKCPSGVRKSKSGFGPKGNANKEKKGGEEDEDIEELNELDEEINVLRSQIHSAKKVAEDWEAKYKEANEKLLLAQGKFEDSEQKLLVMEKKMEKLQTQKGVPNITSNDKWTQTEEQIQQQGRRVSRQQSTRKSSDGNATPGVEGFDVGTGDEDESDDSDLEVDEATVIRKKQEREIKLWENKLRNVKEKQIASSLERKSLKQQQKKLEEELKEQKTRLKELQKEVDKMAKMMKSDEGKEDGDDDDDEEEDDEEEETEEEEEDEDDDEEDTEEESSSESEEESSSEEDDPSASHEDRLNLFMNRVKRWDNILNALRKGNYLVRANIDRLRDDLEDVRIKYHDLEHELNTVLADV